MMMRTATAGRRVGLMGLGATGYGDQAPVAVGPVDPVLSVASVAASSVMLEMARVPKAQRLNKMVQILDRAQPGLGAQTKAKYLALVATKPSDQKDQVMFDVIRAALANVLVPRLLALRGTSVSGLGQTWGTVSGRTSQGVEDANAVMCSTVLPVAGTVSGFLSQLGVGGGGAQGVTGAQAGANMAGCSAGQLAAQAQITQQQTAQAQAGVQAQLMLQQQQQRAILQYALLGGGGLILLAVVAKLLK